MVSLHATRSRTTILTQLLRVSFLVAMIFSTSQGMIPDVAAQYINSTGTAVAPAAVTNAITLSVLSARTEPLANDGAGVVKGQAATTYKWIINEDNTGDPFQARQPFCDPTTNPNYPDGCNWPSIHSTQGLAPIVTQGDQTGLNTATSLTLPNGSYLISVWADGYKLDGVHFTLPMVAPGLLTVTAQPLPLPSATVRIKVFEDNAPVNGQPDEPAEGGLAGFSATLSDVFGLVSTDVFGNPICTIYQHDSTGKVILDAGTGKPVIQTIGGACLSDANGDVVIPNMGPNRYTALVAAPKDQTWYQTTTLEGNIDFDTWVMENSSGYDTEMTVGSEPFPPTFFGFVKVTSLPVSTVTGEVKGVVAAMKNYVPGVGGLTAGGTIWGGFAGAKVDKVIPNPLIALSSLTQGDQAVYVGVGNLNGSFDIKNVPDGDYVLTTWDAPISYLLDSFNVSIVNGQVVDVGTITLTGWWANVHGKVCIDLNHNGKCDVNEPGVPNYTIGVRRRENTMIDRGTVTSVTDASGNYSLDNLYPLTSWVVEEAYNNVYRTVGITYQADNEPTETTILGGGVDFSVLPIIGLSGRFDWAVEPYPAGENGGLVGTVSYDSTRNELDPAYAALEGYQPGIPGITVNLYAPVTNPDGSFVTNPDGSYQKGALLQTYVSDTWERPKNCTARDVNGAPINDPSLPNPSVVQQALSSNTGGHDCLEAPMMGAQFGRVQNGDFVPVNGNIGFGGLTPGQYLAEVVIPNDTFGNPLYKVTSEEDVNVFTGDTYTPSLVPPLCVGPLHTVHVTNPDFLGAGGSPYEGQQRHSCQLKLAEVKDSRSTDLNFNLFTDVPIPGKFLGYIVDDLNIATNPQHLLFGEKMGIPAPIGIYDWDNRLVHTMSSDPNGVFEVLLPSTSTYNCPLPAGPCPGMYRLVGNDPGQPGHLNPNYLPAYRTISASFEVWPGMIGPADLAPTMVGVSIQSPGSQTSGPAVCKVADTVPQFFSVSKPYLAAGASGTARQVTIQGLHFGTTQGTGYVALDNLNLTVVSWSDTQIVVTIPPVFPVGPHQLAIKADNGQNLINSLTFHVLGGSYSPTVYEVGVGKPYATIQSAVNAAAGTAKALVVVYPGMPTTFNPTGAYYENLIMHSALKLQGVGPGGSLADGTYIPGTVINGAGFGADSVAADAWRTLAASLTWSGSPLALEGEVIFVVAQANQFAAANTAGFPAAIDGLTITGGDQLGFPGNINPIGGTPTGQPRTNVETQGGGIFVNGYASYLRITNNVLVSNGGTFGGAIRVGTANIGSNFNDHLLISHNQVVANGGSNLAGGIGLFNGSDNYDVSYNTICGNFSAEYGGGLSHFGYSPNGSIHDNRIYFNRSYDEGGGIMIAGELPANPNLLSQGAGPVNIYNNTIQDNLSNDDGGGIRLLMVGNFAYNIYNNFIVNNVSTHEGGGIAIDDAPNVRVYNNTIMKNLTTATAATSNGLPAPAGLSTTTNSVLLQATLPVGSPTYSKPVLFNNIFWDNRAGSWDILHGGCVAGIGMPAPCPATPINNWDVGVTGLSAGAALNPVNTITQQLDPGVIASPTNQVGVNPSVATLYDIQVSAVPFRGNTRFVGVNIISVNLAQPLLGDYHLAAGSPAVDSGASLFSTISAPAFDIDNGARPQALGWDIGADEFGAVGVLIPITLHYQFIPLSAR